RHLLDPLDGRPLVEGERRGIHAEVLREIEHAKPAHIHGLERHASTPSFDHSRTWTQRASASAMAATACSKHALGARTSPAPIWAGSVIAESPTSGFASAAVNPGKYSPRGVSAGATNHRSPSPLTRIPNSVQLRAIVVTSVLARIPCAASIVALHAAITGLSATRSLSARYRKAWLCCSVGRPVRTRWGASRRPSSAEPARLRLWPSSPICRA